MSTPRTSFRTPRSQRLGRLHELTLHDRDSVYRTPRGADWLWLGLFSAVMLGSGAYVWTQTGLDDAIGSAAFFASVLLAILWTVVIYTLKLSASVVVGPRGLAIVRGPWRTELTWAEVARVAETSERAGGQHYRWLIVHSYDGRELRVRDDMVEDYARFRVEVNARYKLWEEHGGTWGATGGGPFAAEEEVTGLIAWWLVAAGACLLPGLYFALLIYATFVLGIALIALATMCALVALRIALSRQTYTVDRRAVVARRTAGTTTLDWRHITDVARVRSRAWLLAGLGIFVVRVALWLAARADSRAESFTWSPRVPEYLVLRAVGGRRIRVRLHRLARPDELLAWIEFYDRVAHQEQAVVRSRADSPATPSAEPVLPDLGGVTGPVDPWAAARGGEPMQAPGGSRTTAPRPPTPAMPTMPPVAQPGVPPGSLPGPRVTRPVLGGADAEEIDPRILAVIQDVAGAEQRRPTNPAPNKPPTRQTIKPAIEPTIGPPIGPAIEPTGETGPESDWLNATFHQPLFPPSPDGSPRRRDE